MKIFSSKQFAIFGAAMLISSGAYANKEKASYEGAMKSIPHATVSFNNGSNSLSETNRAILRNLVREARLKHAISRATVAAWSDKALPGKDEELLESDRDLAKERSDAISHFLKDEMEVSNVDAFNMAESSNWLARTFKTEDAELKSVFGKKGASVPVTKAEFQIIKNEGGPSAAVVILENKEK